MAEFCRQGEPLQVLELVCVGVSNEQSCVLGRLLLQCTLRPRGLHCEGLLEYILQEGLKSQTRMEGQQGRPTGRPSCCMYEPKRLHTGLWFQQVFSLLRLYSGSMASCCLSPSTGRPSPSFSELHGSLLSCPVSLSYIQLPKWSKLAVLQDRTRSHAFLWFFQQQCSPAHSRGKN